MPFFDLSDYPTAWRLAALASLTAVLFAGGPVRATEQAFSPAETLTWDCKYLGISVGKAVIMVGGSTTVDGQRVWPVVGFAKTDPLFVLYPVKDKYVSWWSPDQHLPLGNELIADEKGKHRRERVRFDRDANRALAHREKEGQTEERTYEVTPSAHDVLSAMLRIRELKLASGDHIELPVFTGHKAFTLKVDVDGKQKIEVDAGTFDTILLRVNVEFSGNLAAKRELKIYVTDDARHLPVRMDAEFVLGSLVADLASYQKGVPQ